MKENNKIIKYKKGFQDKGKNTACMSEVGNTSHILLPGNEASPV